MKFFKTKMFFIFLPGFIFYLSNAHATDITVPVLKDTDFKQGFEYDRATGGVCKNGTFDPNGTSASIPYAQMCESQKIVWSGVTDVNQGPAWAIQNVGSMGSLTDSWGKFYDAGVPVFNCNNGGNCVLSAPVEDASGNNISALANEGGIPVNLTGDPLVVVGSYTDTSDGNKIKVTTQVNANDLVTVDPGGTLPTGITYQPMIYSSLTIPTGGGGFTLVTNEFNDQYFRDIPAYKRQGTYSTVIPDPLDNTPSPYDGNTPWSEFKRRALWGAAVDQPTQYPWQGPNDFPWWEHLYIQQEVKKPVGELKKLVLKADIELTRYRYVPCIANSYSPNWDCDRYGKMQNSMHFEVKSHGNGFLALFNIISEDDSYLGFGCPVASYIDNTTSPVTGGDHKFGPEDMIDPNGDGVFTTADFNDTNNNNIMDVGETFTQIVTEKLYEPSQIGLNKVSTCWTDTGATGSIAFSIPVYRGVPALAAQILTDTGKDITDINESNVLGLTPINGRALVSTDKNTYSYLENSNYYSSSGEHHNNVNDYSVFGLDPSPAVGTPDDTVNGGEIVKIEGAPATGGVMHIDIDVMPYFHMAVQAAHDTTLFTWIKNCKELGQHCDDPGAADRDFPVDLNEYELATFRPTAIETFKLGSTVMSISNLSLDADIDEDGDADGDGLLNGNEVSTLHTDPLTSDTDGDGLYDGFEVQYTGACGFDPLTSKVSGEPDTTEADADCDSDGLSNSDEQNKDFDPSNPDIDGDNLSDGWELSHQTDPTLPDPEMESDIANSNSNLIPDGYERLILTPRSGQPDQDGDGLTDAQEVALGNDPLNYMDPPLVGVSNDRTVGMDDRNFNTVNGSWFGITLNVWNYNGSVIYPAIPFPLRPLDLSENNVDTCSVGPQGVWCFTWGFNDNTAIIKYYSDGTNETNVWRQDKYGLHLLRGFNGGAVYDPLYQWKDAFKIAENDEHACIISHSKGVLCWGGTENDPVLNVPASLKMASDVTQIVVGEKHACVEGPTTGILCWGDDTYGQLTPQLVGGDVLLSSGIHTLASGYNHVCVIVSPGGIGTAVRCWGDSSLNKTTVPSTVNLNSPLRITAGMNHTCVVAGSYLVGGTTVYCWGDDRATSIPTNLTDHSTTPVDVRAGDNRTCAILAGYKEAENALVCWPIALGIDATQLDTDVDGLNDYEEFKLDTNPYNHLDPVRMAVSSGSSYIGLDDADFGLPSDADGKSSVTIWNNDGSFNQMLLLSSKAIDMIVSPSWGSGYVCWLYSTGIECYGTVNGDTVLPTVMDGVKLVGSQTHACVLGTASGVQCWGAGKTNTGTAPEYGQSIVPAYLVGATDVTDIAVGLYYSCAINSTGVHCWGNNTFNKAPSTVSLESGDVPLRLALGDNHACAIVVPYYGGTTVRCWGDNVTPSSLRSTNKRVVPDSVDSPLRITAGANHTCVVNGEYAYPESLKVICWGDGGHYQLQVPKGTGVNDNLIGRVPVDIEAGVNGTCATLAGEHSSVDAMVCWPVSLTTTLNGTGAAPDSDSDGMSDYDEVTNGTMISDPLDSDTDDDNVLDGSDAYPLIPIGSYTDNDVDGAPDSCGAGCPSGMPVDNCPANFNPGQQNFDDVADGGDICDTDDDNDGFLDADDLVPFDINHAGDHDSDGVDSLSDDDDDGDCLPDGTDASPLSANISAGSLDCTFSSNDGSDGKAISILTNSNQWDGAYASLIWNGGSSGSGNDGKILVVGKGNTGSTLADFALVRYNTDGSVDTSLDDGSTANVGVLHDIGNKTNVAMAVAQQSDGKPILAGYSYTIGSSGSERPTVTRYDLTNTNGSPYVDFNMGTTLTTESKAYAVMVDSSGRTVVAGTVMGSNYDGLLMRFDTSGNLDTSFGGGDGIVIEPVSAYNDEFYAVTQQSTGKYVVAGRAGADIALMRYNEDGSVDTSFGNQSTTNGKTIANFGSGITDYGYAMAVQADGKLVVTGVAGTIATVSGVSVWTDMNVAVARYTSNGAVDTSFNGTGMKTFDMSGNCGAYAVGQCAHARSIAIQKNGSGDTDDQLVLAGLVGTYTVSGTTVIWNRDLMLARLNLDGSMDSSFGTSGVVTIDVNGAGKDDVGYSVIVQEDNKIVVSGIATSGTNNQEDFVTLRYHP